MENTIYLWTDRAERVYARLHQRAGHWRVEWGYRDPPGSDTYLPQGHRETSVRDEAVRLMLAHVRQLSDEPYDAEQLARELAEALERAPS
jgi:hypothetical protein